MSDDGRVAFRNGGRAGDMFYRDRWSHDTGFSPIPAMSMVSHCVGTRFTQLIGGVMIVWTVDDEQQMRNYMVPPSTESSLTDQIPASLHAQISRRIRAWRAGCRTPSLGRPRSDGLQCSGKRLHQREQDSVTDSQAGQVHDQPIDTQSHTAGGGHPVLQGLQKVLVDLHRLRIAGGGAK
jgi:hypothetical protein